MAVYVDDMKAPFGRMIMCHMMADTTQELLDMADEIGIAHRWLQRPGTWQEHFDVCLSKRKRAVAAGAIEISRKDLVRIMATRRQEPELETRTTT